MWQAAIKFIKNEEGATAVEYGLIAALIAVAILSTVTSLGTQLKAVFNEILTAVTPAK